MNTNPKTLQTEFTHITGALVTSVAVFEGLYWYYWRTQGAVDLTFVNRIFAWDAVILLLLVLLIGPLCRFFAFFRKLIHTRKYLCFALRTELDALAERYPNLQITYTVTVPDASWRGEGRLITRELVCDYCPAPSDSDFYVCGPPGMVNACIAYLSELNVPSEQVYVERFTGYHALHPHSKQ